MENIIINITLGIVDLIALLFCTAYMVKLLPRKSKSGKWLQIIGWIGFGVLAVLLPNMFLNDMVTMFFLTIYYLVMGWFLHHRSKVGLFYQLVYMFAMCAAQLAGAFLSVIVWQMLEMSQLSYWYYLRICFRVLLLLMVTGVLKSIIERRYVEEHKSLKIRGMLLVPTISVVLILFCLIGGEVFFMRYGYTWAIIYCLLIFVINLYCLYYFYDIAANQKLKHKLELMEQQNDLTHQYYEELEQNYNQSRKIIHDIRNHIQVLEQSQKLDQTAQYFADVYGMLSSLGMKFYTENRMLNIVLNDKLKQLPQEQVSCNLGGIQLNFIADMDITTIFANLLDNALEAREGVADFWLHIRGERIHDFTVIKIANTFQSQQGERKTGKKEHEGIGLENVKQTVGKYHGEITIKTEGEAGTIFSVALMFPGQEEN